MKTPLVPVQILSIYKSAAGQRLPLPARMAQCTPDMQAAILKVRQEVEALGGQLFLSDLFRSYDMQLQAHLDYTSGKKSAFSPAPGGSLHEAGRSLDLDLGSLKIPLAKFWEIAAVHGLSPIIKEPDTRLKEAWHFDCRGSHHKVYEYYVAGKGSNLKPYAALAASAILLIRLGQEIGNMDGQLGLKTKTALAKVGVQEGTLDATLEALEHLAQTAFPNEYRTSQPVASQVSEPAHLIS
jgi:hypothetical protein